MAARTGGLVFTGELRAHAQELDVPDWQNTAQGQSLRAYPGVTYLKNNVFESVIDKDTNKIMSLSIALGCHIYQLSCALTCAAGFKPVIDKRLDLF